MIKLISVTSLSDIQKLRESYINSLPYSQELHIEEHVWGCQYYEIFKNAVCLGYFCVDSEKTLWEFYLVKSALVYSQEIFKHAIDMNYVAAAECKSYDHLLISLCLDFHKKAACSAYLFRDHMDVQSAFSAFEHIQVRIAAKEDFNRLSRIGGDFFYDLEAHIQNKEVFVFFSDNELLGAGTCKKVWHSMNYYDIGMVVSDEHRNKGIGTFIILKLKEYCYENNQIPICGCWYFHHASKRTLEKAGFITNHRIIRFEFLNN